MTNTTEKARFTPGPWEVRDENAITAALGLNPSGWVIVVLPGGGWVGDASGQEYETNLANARLMSAAPQMYEALTQTDENLSKLILDLEDRVSAKGIAQLVRWQDFVRSALAKAGQP